MEVHAGGRWSNDLADEILAVLDVCAAVVSQPEIHWTAWDGKSFAVCVGLLGKTVLQMLVNMSIITLL